MTSSADRAITALRTGHDELVAVVTALGPQDLTALSGASKWTVADVLSHLGSGSEIGLASLDASLGTGPAPGPDFNQGVWDRWNASAPEDQAANFVAANDALVRRYEALDDDTRATARIDLGYLPAPVDVATAAGMRLNEFALHSWDVRVASDPDAAVAAGAVETLLDVAPNLFGWLGKPGPVLNGRHEWLEVRITGPDRAFGVNFNEKVALTGVPEITTATATLPGESWLRLIAGRLAPTHTPSSVSVGGNLTLDELRKIFPGY